MRKLTKLSRYYRARAKPSSALPFFWHIGRPNFGDDINPAFFGMLADRQVRFEKHRDRPHFLGMGSILDRATPHSTVLGSGYIQPPSSDACRPGNVIAVRGELTRSFLKTEHPVLLGDPMVLIDRFHSAAERSNDTVGFVPHLSQTRAAKKLALTGVKIIDPAWPPMRVISEIAQCKRVFSQSLHGLIVADALRVPSLWVAPSSAMKGAEFKFLDYFSTLDAAKSAWPFTRETFETAPEHEFDAAQYRFDKAEYFEAMRDALCR
ncbi:polysaccharide pyruvyl transferase family protein [Celeribacter sp.]|uniref:polysaccharide pyruvyl transferase family protein n=1 Tax=Celeribacter sp. TaxID=1890673 RepID=UPI003A8DBB7B